MVAAAGVYLLMSTWKRGRDRLSQISSENTLPIELFLGDIARRKPPRVPGVAIFLTSIEGGAPPVLLHHLKHNKMLHEKVVLMSVRTEEYPVVDDNDRVQCSELGEGFYQVIARYGFMETPDVPSAAEAGMPELEALLWFGLMAPAKTPRPIIMKLNREITESFRQPDTQEALLKLGALAAPTTPEEMLAFIKAELVKWTPVIKAAGIKVK